MKEQNLFNEDWDTLIILDACRYDFFEKVYRDYFHYNFFWWFMPLMYIAGMIAIVLIACFIVKAVLGGGRSTSSETYLVILKKRYAQGEISKEEYLRMKNDLKED